MKKILLFLVVGLIAVSGCTGLDFLNGGSGTGTTEEDVDIIKAAAPTFLPNPPIPVGNDFTASFEVFNSCGGGGKKSECPEVENVDVQIYNWDLCNITKIGEIEPIKDGSVYHAFREESENKIINTKTLIPGATELIDVEFKAPTNDEIKGFKHTCKIQYKTKYDFIGKTQIDGKIIGLERTKELQRSGKAITFPTTQSIGFGPIKLSFEYETLMPVKAGGKLNVFVNIKNKGKGTFGDIKPLLEGIGTNITILYPKDYLEFVTCTPKAFNITDDRAGVLENVRIIPMIKGESSPIKCVFNVNKTVNDEVIIEKTFQLSALMDYSYEVENSFDVQIKPEIGG